MKVLVSIFFHLVFCVQAESNERWLAKSGYGLMFHYEAFKNHTPQSYNKTIDSFDVDEFVSSVESTKAGYIILSLANTGAGIVLPIALMKNYWV